MFLADTPIDKLPGYQELSLRLKNRLNKIPKEGSVLKLKDIIKVTDNELLEIRGLGNICISEMKKWRSMIEIKIGIQMNDELLIAAEEILQLKNHYTLKKESSLSKALNHLEQIIRNKKYNFLTGKKDSLTFDEKIKQIETEINKIKDKLNIK